MPKAKGAPQRAVVTLTLAKSLAGRHKKHIATAHSLGLRRIGDTTTQPFTPTTAGKVAQIGYLLKREVSNQ